MEIAFRLGIDPRKNDQALRGTVALPHGSGKSVRVGVFAAGEKAREARDAGADVVGGEELVEEVMKGVIDFDAAVATPDMMASVGKAGRVLGPRGLMPNPKTGTVTMDIAKAVADIKGGKVEYRADRTGNVHLIIGKKSFEERKLLENYLAVVGRAPEGEAVVARRVATSRRWPCPRRWVRASGSIRPSRERVAEVGRVRSVAGPRRPSRSDRLLDSACRRQQGRSRVIPPGYLPRQRQ